MSTVIDIIICIITLSHVKETVVYVTNGEEVEMHQLQKLLVSPHFMRGRELSTLVVILSVCHSVIMGSHFQVIKHEHRVLYSH